MKKAAIVAFDDFTDIDIFLAWDILSRVRRQVGSEEFRLLISGTRNIHKSMSGMPVVISGLVEECNDADLVFFGSGPGARRLMRDPAYLKRFDLDPSKQLICSICSGALILGALGLLQGLSATTYPTAVDELKVLGVDVIEDQSLVVHGNIATAAGCLASVELLGWAIERLYGKDLREHVLTSIQPVGTHFISANSEAPIFRS